MATFTAKSGYFVCYVATAALVAGLAGHLEGAEKRAVGKPASTTPPDARTVAAEVDRLILQESAGSPAPRAADEEFLRRVTFDLAGTLPAPGDVTLFGLDPDADKRAKVIDRLLESDDFSRNWARYWRDVIYSRATEMRSLLGQQAFEDWMRDQLAKNEPWDRIATALLTAKGDVRENGDTAILFAQGADPAEVTAEVSRIFLGIQIQCANCHDHPTDKWKREQFHQLAAFFPRMRIQPVRGDNGPRSFLVASLDDAPGGGRFAGMQSPDDFRANAERLFRFADKDRDGKVTKNEAAEGRGGRIFERLIELGDTDKDGALSLDELKKVPPPPDGMRRGSREYFMPDLDNPGSPGTRTDPVFFVGNLKPGRDLSDHDRREKLSKYVTSKSNPWFAKALVNRLWGELLGEAFFMPIDDLGPERQPQHPQVLDLLATSFAANDYDLRWLYRTIIATEAYQRSVKVKRPGEEAASFTAAAPTRLRADQLYSALGAALGVEELGAGFRPQGRPMGNPFNRARGPRQAFAQLFGFDPSTPQDELIGSVPQALFMMNSPLLANLIRGDGNTALGRILSKHQDDRDALSEVYLRTLAREPSADEEKICLEYIAEVKDRREAFEDIQWSLLNSSEFLSKR